MIMVWWIISFKKFSMVRVKIFFFFLILMTNRLRSSDGDYLNNKVNTINDAAYESVLSDYNEFKCVCVFSLPYHWLRKG